MPTIKLFYPHEGTVYHSSVIAATGKYKRPERIRGLLSSLVNETTHAGQLRVMQNKLWALFFHDVEPNQHYRLHVFDFLEAEINVDIEIKVLPTAGPGA